MYQFFRKFFFDFLGHHAPFLHKRAERHKSGIKYILVGGIAAVVQLTFLYILTDVLGVFYVISTIIAFTAALCVSFVLQKFWTFRDSGFEKIKKQFSIYTLLGGFNFFLNPVLLHLVVEKFGLWYMAAQVVVMGILGIESYSINKMITFRKIEKKDTHQTGADF